MEAELFDGTVLEFPDDTDPQVIQSTVKRVTQERRGGVPGSPERIAAAQKRLDGNLSAHVPTQAEIIAANPATRAVIGVGSLLLGPLQLGANVGDKILSAMGNEPVVGKWLNNNIAQLEQMKKAGGHEGFDWAGLLGNLAGGTAALKNLPAMATTGMKALQGAAVGGGLGASVPVVNGGDSFFTDKAIQAGTGAAIGAVAPSVIDYATRGVSYTKNAIRPSPRYLARKAAGDRVDDVIDALMKSKSNVPGYQQTAGEAAAPAGSAEFSALQTRVSNLDPSKFAALKKANDSALRADLGRVASGNTQESAIAAQKAAKAELNDTVVPKIKQVLDYANVQMPRLDTSKLVSSLQGKLRDPSVGVSDINSKVITKVVDKTAEWAAKNGGVIDAKALYEIRKNTVSEEVQRLLGGADPKASAKRAAGILEEIKPLIDDAIEKAGGPGWRAAMDEFSQGMTLISRKKVGAKALEFLDKSPKTLIRLGEGNEPKVISKVFGPGRGSLSEMGPGADVIRRVAEEVANNARHNELAKLGTTSLENIIGAPAAPPTGAFMPFVSAARSWLNKSMGTGLNKGLQRLDPLMLNPQELARVMQESSPQQRAVIQEMLTRAGIISSAQNVGK